MVDKSKKSKKVCPKELRMVNREYDEIDYEPTNKSDSGDKKPSKSSK